MWVRGAAGRAAADPGRIPRSVLQRLFPCREVLGLRDFALSLTAMTEIPGTSLPLRAVRGLRPGQQYPKLIPFRRGFGQILGFTHLLHFYPGKSQTYREISGIARQLRRPTHRHLVGTRPGRGALARWSHGGTRRAEIRESGKSVMADF